MIQEKLSKLTSFVRNLIHYYDCKQRKYSLVFALDKL